MARGVVKAGVLLWGTIRHAAALAECKVEESSGFLSRTFIITGTDAQLQAFVDTTSHLQTDDEEDR